jgi:hypothetical protein
MTALSDQLASLPDPVSPIVRAARATVRGVAPKGSEEIACAMKRPRSPSMMWKLVRYAVGGKVVVTIGTFTKHAAIFFSRGAELDDGKSILEGEGKALRYVTLRSPADAKSRALKAIIRRAFALAARDG